MADSFEKLRKSVFAELKKQNARADNAGAATGLVQQRFGPFLDACLANMGRSRADLARELHIERELVDAILDGLLPESEIDDGLLVQMAALINYEPNVLRLMLGRAINPTLPAEPSREGHSQG